MFLSTLHPSAQLELDSLYSHSSITVLYATTKGLYSVSRTKTIESSKRGHKIQTQNVDETRTEQYGGTHQAARGTKGTEQRP